MTKKKKNIEVYVIDDNKLVCHLLQKTIENKFQRIHVTLLHSAESAIFEINHKVPDMVFLDFYLEDHPENGPNGDVVLKFLKDTIPIIPVVLLTNLRDPIKISELLKIGFDGFIHKSEGNLEYNIGQCITQFIGLKQKMIP